MKLLFDQNISFRILQAINSYFPEATQVRLEGLENFSDKEIWHYARKNDFVIVTFDSDFYDFSLIWGSPPKIVWIRNFNQTTEAIADLIIANKDSIKEFANDTSIDCLEVKNKDELIR